MRILRLYRPLRVFREDYMDHCEEYLEKMWATLNIWGGFCDATGYIYKDFMYRCNYMGKTKKIVNIWKIFRAPVEYLEQLICATMSKTSVP